VNQTKLETPQGEISLDGCDTEIEAAQLVMALLAEGHDWVRMLSSDRQWSSQWTVLERNEKGLPLQIACLEFDGNAGVIRCG
jgi:hypothetical protein